MSTEELLINKYGPLLTLANLGELLDRSENGIRWSLCQENSELGQQLNHTKVKIGRRIYFRAVDIAQFIDKAA